MRGRTLKVWALAIVAVAASGAAVAQDEADAEAASSPRRWRLGFEVKGNYRDSDENAFRTPFPFRPGQIPAGQDRVLLQTVDPGGHFEFSNLSLLLDGDLASSFRARLKVDVVDLYDRNPTSTDQEVDIDELWLRWGRESEPATLPERSQGYLESYGLVSTAFNRFEDQGVEAGLDLGRHVYLKASWTQGNPVFIRDPNALAGDNGTPDGLAAPPDPELGSGVVILYDAEVESPDFGDPELGGGLGVRFGDQTGRRGLDVLAWGYQRKLSETVDLHGTVYGGDLDVLDGPMLPPPFPPASLPIRGDEKREYGANVWIYFEGLSFFGQYVDQELAGMTRTAYEGELAWKVELPLLWAIGGRQLFPSIAPAVRYSRLDPDFDGGGAYPAPSVRWEWTKLDAGLRLGIVDGFDATVEYADHEFFIPALARNGSNNELLVTLRFKR
jgi:hypothetical protein